MSSLDLVLTLLLTRMPSPAYICLDIAMAALLTHIQLSVYERVDCSVHPHASIVPPKRNLRA